MTRMSVHSKIWGASASRRSKRGMRATASSSEGLCATASSSASRCATASNSAGAPPIPGIGHNHPQRSYGFFLQCAILSLTLAAFTFPLTTARADDSEDRYVVVKTKKTITITGDEIDNALIVIKGGRIEAVGKKVDYPSDSRLIDASDLVAMPGMINPRSRIGLPPLKRSGNQSHKKTADSYYPPDDDTYEKLLAAGYTLLGLYADGTGLPGQSLVQSTWKPKPKKGIKDSGLIRITFSRTARDKKILTATLTEARKTVEQEKKAASQPATSQPATQPPSGKSQPLEKKKGKPTSHPTTGPSTKPTTKQAEKPKKPAAPKIKPELAPIVSLLKKTDGYLAHVEFGRASDVIHFADTVKGFDFPRAYAFVGRNISDVHHVVMHELLGGADALVALPPTMPNMPLTVNPYNPPREFAAAGCEVALYPASDTLPSHEHMRERLSLLVRAGLNRTDALKAVTLHAAKYLTLEKDYGSIEKGKRADLIFLDGDPLDPFTKVHRVMIGGEMVLKLNRQRNTKQKRFSGNR